MTTIPGLDNLLADHLDLLRGKRVGLVTNAAGVTRDLQRNVEALRAADIHLVALYSPEHGLTAAADHGALVASGVDKQTGLPDHSLYGETFKPTREMLAGVDLLLYDLQDVGARMYTYSYTLGKVMEACADYSVPLVVLDRPNPIGGVLIEGPVLEASLQSSVGYGPFPLRYAMTLGELANFYKRELGVRAELQVIPLQHWKRRLWYDETGLEWVSPSPNIPHPHTAVLYPGTCLVEGTNLSAGRGTPLPFEIVGAPWVDGPALAAELNALHLDGVHFRPHDFTPTGDKFADIRCSGVQVHVTDRDALRPVVMGLHLVATARRLFPAQFEWATVTTRGDHFDKLIGKACVRDQIERGEAVDVIAGAWEQEQKHFAARRAGCLIYDTES